MDEKIFSSGFSKVLEDLGSQLHGVEFVGCADLSVKEQFCSQITYWDYQI